MAVQYKPAAFVNYDNAVRQRVAKDGLTAFSEVSQEEVVLQFCPENMQPKFSKKGGGSKKLYCHQYNDGECHYKHCIFAHKCMACNEAGHGLRLCPAVKKSKYDECHRYLSPVADFYTSQTGIIKELSSVSLHATFAVSPAEEEVDVLPNVKAAVFDLKFYCDKRCVDSPDSNGFGSKIDRYLMFEALATAKGTVICVVRFILTFSLSL